MKLLLSLLLLTSVAQAQPSTCIDVFASQAIGKSDKIYPAGVVAKSQPGGFMQIGYESEYLFSESASILRDYAPAANIMPTATWLAKTDAERLAWLTENFKEKPEFAANSGLFKLIDTPFLPSELLIDSTGNVEIVLAPVDSYQQWEQEIDWIAARYGVGSQQAMISKPRESAFKARPEANVETLVKQATGWLVFTNLRDMFAKLEGGARRYQKDPQKLSAQFLDHAFLGPMNKLKRDMMERYLRANARGNMYGDDAKQFVRKRDVSFKYTGGPSYRPDVAGPGRFSWEIRNAHKDLADLKMKVKRDLAAHEAGLASYEAFASVPAFDTLATFERLQAPTQKVLAELFPSKADPRFDYPEPDLRALEVYRNFSMPLQDYSGLVSALTRSPADAAQLNKSVNSARLAYITGLHVVAQKFRAGQITRAQAKAEVMGLMCNWSVKSGLASAFDESAVSIGHEKQADAA